MRLRFPFAWRGGPNTIREVWAETEDRLRKWAQRPEKLQALAQVSRREGTARAVSMRRWPNGGGVVLHVRPEEEFAFDNYRSLLINNRFVSMFLLKFVSHRLLLFPACKHVFHFCLFQIKKCS